MKRKVCFGLVFALVAVLAVTPSLLAQSPFLKLKVTMTGSVVVAHGKSLALMVTGENNNMGSDGTIATQTTVDFYQIQAAVINPLTGKVVVSDVGTSAIAVNKELGGPYFDSNGNYVAGQSDSKSFSLTIPSSVGAGVTLAAVIYVMDNNQNVIGTASWGFITD